MAGLWARHRELAPTEWKDVTRLHPNDPAKEWFGAKPYRTEFRDGDGFKAIVATCEAGGLRVEREMRLANESAELTVLIRLANDFASTPRRVPRLRAGNFPTRLGNLSASSHD